MSGTFFNVSGIDPNDGARIVFVWCRNNGPGNDIPLASGHVVGEDARNRPPGIQVGQYSITFPLPYGCSAENIVVTHDKDGKEPLSGVTLTQCLIREGFQSGGTITPDAPPMRAGATPAPGHSINR